MKYLVSLLLTPIIGALIALASSTVLTPCTYASSNFWTNGFCSNLALLLLFTGWIALPILSFMLSLFIYKTLTKPKKGSKKKTKQSTPQLIITAIIIYSLLIYVFLSWILDPYAGLFLTLVRINNPPKQAMEKILPVLESHQWTSNAYDDDNNVAFIFGQAYYTRTFQTNEPPSTIMFLLSDVAVRTGFESYDHHAGDDYAITWNKKTSDNGEESMNILIDTLSSGRQQVKIEFYEHP